MCCHAVGSAETPELGIFSYEARFFVYSIRNHCSGKYGGTIHLHGANLSLTFGVQHSTARLLSATGYRDGVFRINNT
jgi:hypothetical protein